MEAAPLHALDRPHGRPLTTTWFPKNGPVKVPQHCALPLLSVSVGPGPLQSSKRLQTGGCAASPPPPPKKKGLKGEGLLPNGTIHMAPVCVHVVHIQSTHTIYMHTA